MEERSSDEEKDMTCLRVKSVSRSTSKIRGEVLKNSSRARSSVLQTLLLSIQVLSIQQLILNAELNLLLNRQRAFIHHLIDDSAHREDAADAGAYLG